ADCDRRGAGRPRPAAERAVVVVAPALDRTGGEQRARMVEAGADRGDPAAQAADGDRRRADRRRPFAELAVVVVAPALDRAAGEQCAGVVAAGPDRGDPAAQAADGDRRGAARPRPVAELAVEVLAPALDRPAGEQRARMVDAGADRADAAPEAAEGDRRRAVCPRPVAELAAAVVAPALDCPAAEQRARMVEAGADRGDPAAQAANGNRGRAGRPRPAAELAAAVVAPALDCPAAEQRARMVEAGAD